MNVEHVNYPQLKQPFGAYCHAVRVDSLLFLSGFTALDTPAQHGDIVAQTEATLDQIKSILEAEGGGMKDIVKVTIYVTELDRLMDIHKVRSRYFGSTYPASTLVRVVGLVRPELKIEIEAVAAVPQRS